jgi:predicted dinucleotide-binding enzyme
LPRSLRRSPTATLCYDAELSPSVFVWGDDDRANALVELLVFDLGAQPVDAGSLVAARLIESR